MRPAPHVLPHHASATLTDKPRLCPSPKCREEGLHPVGQVVVLHKLLRLLAQTRRARLLALVGLRGNRLHGDGSRRRRGHDAGPGEARPRGRGERRGDAAGDVPRGGPAGANGSDCVKRGCARDEVIPLPRERGERSPQKPRERPRHPGTARTERPCQESHQVGANSATRPGRHRGGRRAREGAATMRASSGISRGRGPQAARASVYAASPRPSKCGGLKQGPRAAKGERERAPSVPGTATGDPRRGPSGGRAKASDARQEERNERL